ncbi:MAG: tetratricopeptide repeat protein, partial [Syntrophales bacterium]
ERKDVFSAMFWMLTMVAYILYVEQPKAWRYILTIILFTIGLMAKPMLVTLPFVLLLLDYWPLKRFDTVQVRRLVIEKIPLFILSLIFSIIGYVSQKSGGVLNLVSVPVLTCIENALRSYIIYLQKLFWPADLAVLYPIHHPFVIPFWQISGSLLILVGVTIFALWIKKKHPYLLVGWFWYLGTLLPVIGIFQLGHQAYADRYTYIPLIGIFVMIAWGMADLVRRIPFQRVITTIGVIVIFIILSIVTQNQIGYWQNTTSLMTHAIETHPENYMAHWYLGTYQKSIGQPAEAIANFEEALKIDPVFNIYHELSKMLWQQGRFNEAISYLTTCSNLDPENAQTYNDMGIILMSMNRKEQAILYFNKAIQIDPNYNVAINNLNRALSSQQ